MRASDRAVEIGEAGGEARRLGMVCRRTALELTSGHRRLNQKMLLARQKKTHPPGSEGGELHHVAVAGALLGAKRGGAITSSVQGMCANNNCPVFKAKRLDQFQCWPFVPITQLARELHYS